MRHRLFAEGARILFRRFYKEIKSPLRLRAGKAQRRETLVYEITVFLILAKLSRLAEARGAHALEEHRRADISQHPPRAGNGSAKRDALLALRRHGEIADALAGQREGFAERVTVDRIRVKAGDIRYGVAVVDKIAVRLVGENVDRMAVLRRASGEQRGDFLYALLPQHNAGGIVRRVQNHQPRFLVHRGGEGLIVELERFRLGGYLAHDAAGSLGIGAVFRKVRRERYTLIPRREQRAAPDGKARGRAARHVDILRRIGHGERAVEIIRHSLANLRQPLIGAVGVQLRGGHFLHKPLRRFLRRGGRRNARRADAEIVDIFRADLFGAAHGVIGDLPDGVAGRAERVYFGWDHVVFPRFTRYSTALR